MAFQTRDLSVLAYANGFTLWHYRSGDDALAAIAGDDYFNPAADLVRPADLLMLEDSAGSAGIRRVADVAAGVVTIAATA